MGYFQREFQMKLSNFSKDVKSCLNEHQFEERLSFLQKWNILISKIGRLLDQMSHVFPIKVHLTESLLLHWIFRKHVYVYAAYLRWCRLQSFMPIPYWIFEIGVLLELVFLESVSTLQYLIVIGLCLLFINQIFLKIFMKKNPKNYRNA